MSFKQTGKLHSVFETKQITERFTKREFVVELADNPKYPQLVLFQLTGDRCDQLDDYKVGDEVEVEFRLRGREWTSPRGEIKYFNSLDVWTLHHLSDAPRDDQPPPPDDQFAPSEEDIPF
jgi:uncharacterized OB-fold protein